MVPSKVGKVIPLRAPRRHRPKAKKTAVVRVGLYQRTMEWLTGNTTRGTVLLAGVVAGLIIGAIVGTMIVSVGQYNVEEYAVESLG